MTPASEERDWRGSGFPDSSQGWFARLTFRAHPRMKFRERSKQLRLPDFAHRVNVKVEVVLGSQYGP